MVVFILEKVPATVRGEMSRWLMEPRHGVFIGSISAMVRDRLWDEVSEKVKAGGALLLYSSPNEQGFKVRATGDTSRSIQECEGLSLVHIPTEKARKKDTASARSARAKALVVRSSDQEREGTEGTLDASLPRAPRQRNPFSSWRRRGYYDALYDLVNPAEAEDIAQHCHDPGYSLGQTTLEVFVEDPASIPIGVKWRPIRSVDIFAE
jgi:CRISPR-associated protein Cas2